jgi:hypothetical protein
MQVGGSAFLYPQQLGSRLTIDSAASLSVNSVGWAILREIEVKNVM